MFGIKKKVVITECRTKTGVLNKRPFDLTPDSLCLASP